MERITMTENDQTTLVLKFGPGVLRIRQLIIEYRAAIIESRGKHRKTVNMAHASILELRVSQMYTDIQVKVVSDNHIIIFNKGKEIDLAELFLE